MYSNETSNVMQQSPRTEGTFEFQNLEREKSCSLPAEFFNHFYFRFTFLSDGLVRLDAEMLRPLAPLRDTAAYFAERADRYSSVKVHASVV